MPKLSLSEVLRRPDERERKDVFGRTRWRLQWKQRNPPHARPIYCLESHSVFPEWYISEVLAVIARPGLSTERCAMEKSKGSRARL
jgi:hypothetical protein